jgi:hypothetical protein
MKTFGELVNLGSNREVEGVIIHVGHWAGGLVAVSVFDTLDTGLATTQKKGLSSKERKKNIYIAQSRSDDANKTLYHRMYRRVWLYGSANWAALRYA